jgi:hypothetical protein
MVVHAGWPSRKATLSSRYRGIEQLACWASRLQASWYNRLLYSAASYRDGVSHCLQSHEEEGAMLVIVGNLTTQAPLLGIWHHWKETIISSLPAEPPTHSPCVTPGAQRQQTCLQA